MKVSNSEALSIGSCETKWKYAFHPAYHLEPKYQSLALVRGLIGHKALEIFFQNTLDGNDFAVSTKAATEYLVTEMGESFKEGDANKITAITELIPIIGEYFKSDVLLNFLNSISILGVEVGFETKLANGIILPGRVDLLVRYTKGPFKGETVPVDNKFVYNFWSEDDFRMNSQIPTYIHVLRQKYPDAVIKRGVINQLRHRSNAQERFTMTDMPFKRNEIANVIENHVILSDRVAFYKRQDIDVIEDTIGRTLSKYSCGNCGFKLLCKSELTDGNTAAVIKMDYRDNSYGYGGDEED